MKCQPTPIAVPASTPHALRVLVVDDDAACAAGLAEAICDLGAETRICLNGPDALAAARAFHPELVLLDLEMPGASGFDVANAIRRVGSLTATKLIALSGHSDAEARTGSAQAGFDLHLAKPLRLSLLEDIIDLARLTMAGHA
ncbi:MAG: response regulator [Asticcacaulis sp.]|uniref:response regulator n=1 Tax=Asticcacaulis sp. TaxID=1872648 RepID=UPI0039E61437